MFMCDVPVSAPMGWGGSLKRVKSGREFAKAEPGKPFPDRSGSNCLKVVLYFGLLLLAIICSIFNT